MSPVWSSNFWGFILGLQGSFSNLNVHACLRSISVMVFLADRNIYITSIDVNQPSIFKSEQAWAFLFAIWPSRYELLRLLFQSLSEIMIKKNLSRYTK
jgi:hypothetical protein